MLNYNYIKVDGTVNFLVTLIWLVFVIAGNVAKEIEAEVEISPVKSAEVLTTLPDIPVGEEVDVA